MRMHGYLYRAIGGPGVLEPFEADIPEPAPLEVTIQVDYAGMAFADVMFRRGQFEVPLPYVPGLEVVGTVVAAGKAVSDLQLGQRVAALTFEGGGYATHVSVRASDVFALDSSFDNVSGAQVASVLMNAAVAVGVIDIAARPEPGDRIAITAAAGGVGTLLTQLIASVDDTEVYGLVSDLSKVQVSDLTTDVRYLTYADAVGPGSPLAAGVEIIADSIGGPYRPELRRYLAPLGRHVIYGDAAAADSNLRLNELWSSSSAAAGYNIGYLAGTRTSIYRRHVEQGLEYLRSQAISVPISLVKLSDARRVHQDLESRTTSGKFVIDVSAG